MVQAVVLSGLLMLLCQQVLVMAHFLNRPYSANSLTKLKVLLQQLEENLAASDYEEANPDADASPAGAAWDRDIQRTQTEDVNPQEALQAQKNRLLDLLMTTRSKGFSSCFGGRLDRIGSSSNLGCNTNKGASKMN
ncbi:natriuretic peptides A [Denticeps clupeoides]|uniref:Uncharacterized protein n=1 Tax=Denticeps clupeoides TaxID=299321 RepID=A0AAY4BJI6_9TELE|nr:natriuretic peptides A [Denticeps clupeoides]